jgi:uncharacterized membrane protein (UPF0127 family)
MPDRRRFLAMTAFAVGSVALASPLAAQPMGGQAQEIPVDPAPLRIRTAGGEKSFSVEVADDDRERERGLMFRRFMEDNRGMLFVFSSTRRLGFWMKNTPMALDLVFIGEDGRVTAIRPGVPFSEAPISPPEPARFVLELKSGIARRNGIAVGDRIFHPEIDRVAGRR